MDHQDSPPQDTSEKTGKKSKACVTWVQDYLSRRQHSEKELLQKLLQKEFTEEESLLAISFAKERKWLEDPEELSERVYREWSKKNKSHKWICQYLDEKGLPVIEKWAAGREAKKAAYHLSKKFGKINNDNYKRASSNLAAKGFSFGDFKSGLELLNKELEDAESSKKDNL